MQQVAKKRVYTAGMQQERNYPISMIRLLVLQRKGNLSKNLFPKLRDLDAWVRMGGVMPLLLNTTDFPSGDEIYAALNRKLKRAAKKTQEDKLANGEYII